MLDKTKENIIILKNKGLDLHDIKMIKNIAIENKMYDLVICINNEFSDYLKFVNQIQKNHL